MTRRRWLLCYDIRAPARLRRIHQVAKAFGQPLQYSVFVCDLDRSEKVQLETALRETMLLSIDSVALIDLGLAGERGRECFEFIGHRPYRLPRGGPTIV